MKYADAVLAAARSFVFDLLPYNWSKKEEEAIRPFFSNTRSRITFMRGLPEDVGSALLAMYSRLKNPRGLRGTWVDSLLPTLLAEELNETIVVFNGDGTKFLSVKKITSLEGFISYSPEAGDLYKSFMAAFAVDPQYRQRISSSKRVQRFMGLWLDKYGHNSIARTATLIICFEQISALAAKSLEWARPGAGYIELSTRFVDMSKASWYPVERELLDGWGVDPERINASNERLFWLYRELAGERFDGPFPTFLRERYKGKVPDPDLEAGVIGETCDVLGNLLPCSVLTSVGVAVSGESFPQIIKHLLLDDTPENVALFELLVAEMEHHPSAKQFARHYVPNLWDLVHWDYLHTDPFQLRRPGDYRYSRCGFVRPVHTIDPVAVGNAVESLLGYRLNGMELSLSTLATTAPRGSHDKLPSEFEAFVASFQGVMSMRGWRDLQRMGFCSHNRTFVTPNLGFYEYGKPAPRELIEAFNEVRDMQREAVYDRCIRSGVPAALAQYPLAMGHLVGFTISANLRQWEFCGFQRTAWNVNHEVREVFCGSEHFLRQALPWWKDCSRADTTRAYAFARGNTPLVIS